MSKKHMEIQKIFSNVEDPEENLYSVLMSEDELSLFSEFQKEVTRRFSQRESLEDIYKTILNPIILEADKVYGKKSLYIPRLLENGEIKEGKTLLIGQHPDADLKSDSCYEIFDGLWKDSSGKYWTEKSGFLGRKTWKEVEDPKKYMSEIYRGFNISSRDLSKVCGNLSKAIYEDSLDKIKGNPQYWKLPEIKYF